MSVIVKGMKMPSEQYGKMEITLYPNGHVVEYVGDIGRVWEAIPVPPHGRLIDADAPIPLVDTHGKNIEVTVAHIIENNLGIVNAIIESEGEDG